MRPAFLVLAIYLLGLAPLPSRADSETIAIIGTGDLGDSFGARLAGLGYDVVFGSRSYSSDRVRDLVETIGHGARAASQADAAAVAEIVILPINWPAMESAAQNLGDLSDKIVIDPSVPWTQAEDGYPVSMLETSSAELIQQWNPGAKVVKAFGTMGSGVLDNPGVTGEIITIPIASDHKEAKVRVAALAVELGLDPVDFGPLRMARFVESLGLIYMIPLLQHRSEEWEFTFQRNSDWVCRFKEEWADPVYDADDLAELPTPTESSVSCQ